MRIAIIGAGRLATNLGKALNGAGHDIVQVYSRTREAAGQLAAIVGASPLTDVEALTGDADAYVIALKDSVVPLLLPSLCKGREQKVFLHTAGSLDLSIFSGMALHYGVLYPMQTFSKEREVSFNELPLFLEANDALTAQTLVALAESISTRIYPLSSQDRKQLHLAAVFACNFVNHLYALSADILQKSGIPFDVMLPLIDETALKVHTMTPAEAQTGPALRFDENIIRMHTSMLHGTPLLRDLYERLSLSIHQKHTAQ